MIKQSWGRVVNITSIIGQIGNFDQANYVASKAGSAAFTKSSAKKLFATGIMVNAVAPGFTGTEMMTGIPEEVRKRLLDQIVMKRFAKSEEVARACVYLRSRDGDHITGAELSINPVRSGHGVAFHPRSMLDTSNSAPDPRTHGRGARRHGGKLREWFSRPLWKPGSCRGGRRSWASSGALEHRKHKTTSQPMRLDETGRRGYPLNLPQPVAG
jgi:enoyl-ACP reductase-like protein